MFEGYFEDVSRVILFDPHLAGKVLITNRRSRADPRAVFSRVILSQVLTLELCARTGVRGQSGEIDGQERKFKGDSNRIQFRRRGGRPRRRVRIGRIAEGE